MINLARHNPSPEVIEQVSNVCFDELTAAGITPVKLSFPLSSSEVPSCTFGQLGLWGFKRAWYYWVATGPGIPVEIAEKLHATHGKVVRVDGHCGCPSPREWFKGFGVGCYHIDSQEGLNALAATLREIYDPAKDPHATPRTGAVKSALSLDIERELRPAGAA